MRFNPIRVLVATAAFLLLVPFGEGLAIIVAVLVLYYWPDRKKTEA